MVRSKNLSGVAFDPDEDIPDLSGKVVLVTGGNAGLGYQTIKYLLKSNAHIFMISRSAQKSADAIAALKKVSPNANITFLQADLTSLASVQNAAKEFLSRSKRLDILMANAGIMNVPAALTTDGYEIQFGTNHMGHALLMKLLLPTMLETAKEPGADVRIVSLTSTGFRGASSIDYQKVKTKMASSIPGYGYMGYAQSKLANILYVKELGRRFPEITSVVVHPGVVTTDLVNSKGWFEKKFIEVMNLGHLLTPEEGAVNQTWAAVGRGEIKPKSGEYYLPVGIVGKPTKASSNAEMAKKLWEWTDDELKQYSV
ncbi:short-chain dehydrogenase [Rhizodiscina lignyota]|uniref:Short-chain dehydrogenase n=1 Tax=Rhizodiscina lignyota TaxID=1504668 RepID=A0A9P4IMB9_9PEZI|nr:short-chain dehydrogenase [Rhizodiscina lignyota]